MRKRLVDGNITKKGMNVVAIYSQTTSEWSMFDTAIGVCGVAYREDAHSLFLLPDKTASTLRKPSANYEKVQTELSTKGRFILATNQLTIEK
ncbi:MAG: hypothetical protein WCI18_15635 [Pseudomonadota bacterium]